MKTKKAPAPAAPPPPPSFRERTHLLSGTAAELVRAALRRRAEIHAQADAEANESIRFALNDGVPDAEKVLGPFSLSVSGSQERGKPLTITTTQEIPTESTS